MKSRGMKQRTIYIIGIFNGAQILAAGIALYTHEVMWVPAILSSVVGCGMMIIISENLY